MLADLPNEVLDHIAAYLESERDVNALARTDRYFFHLLDPYLYRRNVKQSACSALRWAAECGQAVTARKSIKVGASGECRELNQTHRRRRDAHPFTECSPLFLAVRRGRHEIVKIILELPSVDVNRQDRFTWTPLYWAVESGYVNIVELLLDCDRVRPNLADDQGASPLSYAAQLKDDNVVDALLRSDNVDADYKNAQGRTPLSLAAEAVSLATVRLLLSSGRVEPDSVDRKGQTPFSWDAHAGHVEMVKLLFETGDGKVNPGSRDIFSRTPLSHAIIGHNDTSCQVLQLLCEMDEVELDSPANDGMAPLADAAVNTNAVAVKLLLRSRKVDANRTWDSGRTPLHGAVERHDEEIIQILLDHDDVDPNILNGCRRTPLGTAALYGDEAIVRIFLQSSKVMEHDCKDIYGRTPFW